MAIMGGLLDIIATSSCHVLTSNDKGCFLGDLRLTIDINNARNSCGVIAWVSLHLNGVVVFIKSILIRIELKREIRASFIVLCFTSMRILPINRPVDSVSSSVAVKDSDTSDTWPRSR